MTVFRFGRSLHLGLTCALLGHVSGCSKQTTPLPMGCTGAGCTDTMMSGEDDGEADDGDDTTSTTAPGSGVTTFPTSTSSVMTFTTSSGTAVTSDSDATTAPDDCTGIERPLGTYGDCKLDDGSTDVSVCNGTNVRCLVSSVDTAAAWGVCLFKDCTSDCDCPAALGGTAVPRCLDVISNDPPECVLSCADSTTCPAGMRCLTGSTPICVWDQPAPLYGDCINGGDCGEGLTCVYDAGNPSMATRGVCVGHACSNENDCPVWPGTNEVDIDCDNVTEAGPNVCYLGCDGNIGCPEGMECFSGVRDICMWPDQ